MDPQMLQSVMADPNKMHQLAMTMDPAPILQELSLGGKTDASGNFTSNTPQTGPGSEAGAYSAMVGNVAPGESGGMPTGTPGAAPIDPRSMMALNSMMPKPQQPQFMHGTAPHAGTPVHITIPDVSQLVRLNLGPHTPGVPPLGSAGGR